MFKKKKFIVVIILLVCILLFILSFIISDKRKLSDIEKIIKDSTLTVNKVINKPINYIDNKIKEIKLSNKMYDKYNKLYKKYEKLKSVNNDNDELKKEIKELQKVLELNNTLESKYINSSVIIRNIGYYYDELTIDKGSKHKRKKDMAVITSDGLIGTISKVSNLNSVVKLLTTDDINNKISVKIKVNNDYLYGLMVGYDKKTKCFIVEGIADNKEIPKGSVVTTTNFNDIPGGILIGKVEKIKKDNFDLSRTLLVRSNVNFDNIKYVTVLGKDK